jgi:hypothetical protein
LSNAQAEYHGKMANFEKKLTVDNSFPPSEAKNLVSILGKVGELVVLSELDKLTPANVFQFQDLLDDAYQVFVPTQAPPPYTPPAPPPYSP